MLDIVTEKIINNFEWYWDQKLQWKRLLLGFWFCFWLQNIAGVVLPDRICSILRITKVLMKYLCILSGSTYLCPCSTQNQNQCFLHIKKTKLQDILEFLVIHIIIEAGFSVVTHLTVHVVVWKQSDKHTQPRLTLRVPSLSFYQNWSLLIFKNYSKIWMHAFLTTFFIQIMPLHFFCVKSWCCTVHQKSNILFKKSTFFSCKFQNNC